MNPAPATPPAAPPPRPASRPGLVDELQGLLTGVRLAWGERVELLSLELASAVRAAAQIVVLLVAAAIVAVTAWLGLWGVATGVLISIGMPWALALLIVVVINLAAAAFALTRARRLLARLSLPATRRHLSLRPVPAPATPPQMHPSASAQGAPAAVQPLP